MTKVLSLYESRYMKYFIYQLKILLYCPIHYHCFLQYKIKDSLNCMLLDWTTDYLTIKQITIRF